MFEDPKEKQKSRSREISAIVVMVIIAAYFFMQPKPQAPIPQPLSPVMSVPSGKKTSFGSKAVSNNSMGTVIPAFLNKAVKEVKVEKDTNRYQLGFSSYYGTLNNIVIKDFKDANQNHFNITPLLRYDTSMNSQALSLPLLYNIQGLRFEKGFQVSQTANTVTFTQKEGGVVLTKIYQLNPDNYDIGLTISVKNASSSDMFTEGQLSWGQGLGPNVKPELQIVYDKNINASYFDVKNDDEITVKNGVKSAQSSINWVALDNRYFLMAIMPKTQKDYKVDLINNVKVDLFNQTLNLKEGIHLKPGEEFKREFVVYVGPKTKSILKSYNNQLERTVERGWFFFPLLGSLLISLLAWINSLVGSYALAIIIFSALLKIVFQPLNHKSMIMMSRQADMQVKITALKEKYKDKVTQNAKMMELYKQENANPLKGCLPLLIQIPFFIAFYNELPVLINLASEHFLWIKDLSSPDTVYLIDMFKNIPVLPYRLNILPIIIAFLTFYQTWLTTRNQKQVNSQAKMMMYLMPLIFLFILWNAPSGLNLYWLVQTVGTILAQTHFNKNKEAILEKARITTKQNKKIKK